MGLFKKKEKSTASEGPGSSFWDMVGARLDRHHKHWAAFMRRQSECLPLWARWSVFIAFTASSVCLCFYTAVSAFYARPVTARPAVIKINRYSLMTNPENLRAKTIVSENEYKKITGFKRYLDSVSGIATGKLWVDSLLAERPGLTDSICIIENIYLSQLKK
jgi:hypothetical protein